MPRITDGIAVRIGLILGGVTLGVGLIIALLIAFSAATHSTDAGLSLGACVAFLAILGLLVESGHLTAQRTGSIGSAVLSGVISGFGAGVGIALFSPATLLAKGQLHASDLIGSLIITLIFMLIFGCMFAGFGAGLGALGGLIGQSYYRKHQAQAPVPSANPPN
ncbi:MAG: hypothetical protein OJF49_003410 [Ktedonobacterales bacterium]|jgi:hypothetical protein|nr:MAG: hypothetical protein OJF49_003410 [Ktedonobacterales bacterium]